MGLCHRPDEVLHVPARVSLRPLVELVRLPLGLLVGREASDLSLPEEHYRNYPVTCFLQQILCLEPHSLCLLISGFTLELGGGLPLFTDCRLGVWYKNRVAAGRSLLIQNLVFVLYRQQ